MAKEKLQIILDADWRGKSAVQQADRDVSRLDKSVAGVRANWKSFAVGAGIAATALAGIGAAAKLAFGELQRGAALDLAAGQFDKLTESIGSTSDAMLNRLQAASRGLVSDANLIAGANEIMAGKLAKTEDGVVRLSAAASALNVDMGLLAQTINNQSILRLDNMGVAAEDVVPKFNALKAAGIGVKEAFTQALTEALEAKVALLGEASETTAGKIQIMQTAWENARDAFSVGFAEGAAESVARFGDSIDVSTESFKNAGTFWGSISASLITNIFGVSAAQDELKRAYDAGIISLSEYNQKSSDLQFGTIGVGNALAFVKDKQDLWLFSLRASTSGLGDLIAVASSADRVLLQYANSANAAAAATSRLPSDFKLSRDRSSILSITDAQYAAGAGNRGVDSVSARAEKQAEAMRNLRREGIGVIRGYEEMSQTGDELAQSFFGIGSGASAAATAVADLAAETGSYFDQARRATEFNAAEFFYEQALAAGASAQQLKDVLTTSGLETPERAEEIYQQALQRQRLAASAQAFVGGGLGLEEALAGGQGLAAADFSGSTVDQSRTVNVGGVTIIINGSASPADLEMAIDNSFAKVEAAEGVAP
jgi:hypothetical protein